MSTVKFDFMEETNVTTKGKQTFWYTMKSQGSGKFLNKKIVDESLSFKKEEALRIYNLIIENPEGLNTKKVIHTKTFNLNDE